MRKKEMRESLKMLKYCQTSKSPHRQQQTVVEVDLEVVEEVVEVELEVVEVNVEVELEVVEVVEDVEVRVEVQTNGKCIPILLTTWFLRILKTAANCIKQQFSI